MNPTNKDKPDKVLVMTDDTLLEKLMVSMLDVCGCAAYTCKNAEQLLDHYRAAKKSRKPFDVVILDINNPRNDPGKELIRSLLAVDPGMRIVVISGRIHRSQLLNGNKHGFRGVLAKPFTVKDLHQVLRGVRHGDNEDSTYNDFRR
jgi:two-component system cell cycle sensor histidine kinase/response regulator CckA